MKSGTKTMNISDLMKELGISYATAYCLTKENDFPSFRIGRRILIDRDGLEKWMKERMQNK